MSSFCKKLLKISADSGSTQVLSPSKLNFLVHFHCFWLSRTRPLLLVLAVTVSSASTVSGCHGLAIMVVSSASTVFGCHGLVGFYCFWLSRSRPLLLLWLSQSRLLLLVLARSRPLLLFLAVTVSSSSTVLGCHGLFRFYCFWLSRSRPRLLFLAVTVSSASTFLAVTVLSASTVFGCHGLGLNV